MIKWDHYKRRYVLNNWLNKLERKFGRYAIPNLTRYVIVSYLIGYLLAVLKLTDFISLDPYLVMHGQVWRLVTWVFMPPGRLGIFTIIMLLFYYQLGMALERTWGYFRYNLYLFSGFLFTMIGTLIIYSIGAALGPEYVGSAPFWGQALSMAVSTYYVNMSIFLAFAASYPDMQILLYFIIPLKIKWLAIFDAVLIAYDFIRYPWYMKAIIIISLLNFLLFFLATRNYRRVSPEEIHRKYNFRKNVNNATRSRSYTAPSGQITKHKCAVCGRTELDDPNLEFRFCSKCNGNYEYCQDHLFTHTHVK
ncbi:MAG: hypothetical protein K6F99_03670 [Lachnospiraceae bacterium]|nr:hypothetical protein [Lachnospiraceae bacterium]